jgi:hemerythrin superfamily protein
MNKFSSTKSWGGFDRSLSRHETALIGSALAGLAIGLFATVTRKAAMQAPTALAPDWVEGLTREHKAVLTLFDKLEATERSQTGKRKALVVKLKLALTKHAVEEENVVYPALREAGEESAVDGLSDDHAAVKHYLYRLTMMEADSPEFMKTVRAFRADIEKHMKEEERDLFPRLKAKLDDAANKRLSAMVNKEGYHAA